jgi:hypothetical protein
MITGILKFRRLHLKKPENPGKPFNTYRRMKTDRACV